MLIRKGALIERRAINRIIAKVFSQEYDHVENVDLSKGYWNPERKLELAAHFFEIISLESQYKMLTSTLF